MDQEKLKKIAKSSSDFFCIVCSEKFSSSKALIFCAICNSAACKVHWKSISGLNFCDICVRNDITSDIKALNSSESNKLRADLKTLKNREEATVAEIQNKTLIVNDLESKLNEKLTVHDLQILNLTEKINTNTTIIENSQIEVKNIEEKLKDSEKVTEEMLEKFSVDKCEVSKLNRESEVLNKDIGDLEQNLKFLINQCNETIPYRRLRNTACNKCHKDIKIKFREDIISIVMNKRASSLMPSLMIRENKISSRNNTPCTCQII